MTDASEERIPGDMPAERRVQTICLLILAAIAVGAALQALSSVMIPFALAMFLAIALAPVVDGLAARTRLSRLVSVGLTMLLGALMLTILGGVVASSLGEFDTLFFSGEGEQATAYERFMASFDDDEFFAAPLMSAAQTILPRLAGALGTLLSQGVTVLIFLMFLLVEQGRPRPGDHDTVQGRIRERVKQYISVKVLTSSVTGITVGVALWLIGVPGAVLFGLFTFLLNFIPTIGSIVAVLLPIPILLAAEPISYATIALALVIPGAIQFVVGQVWENKLLGDKFDLRASVVLLGLMFWGYTWGIVGMLLATPITAVLKTLFQGFEMTRPIAALMGQTAKDVPVSSEGAAGP